MSENRRRGGRAERYLQLHCQCELGNCDGLGLRRGLLLDYSASRLGDLLIGDLLKVSVIARAVLLLLSLCLCGVAFAQHTATLTCTPASTGTPATSFNFYRSAVSGGPYTLIGSNCTCSFVDTAPLYGSNYYVSTGVNSFGESGFSDEALGYLAPPPAPAAVFACNAVPSHELP